jgi:hypothetical protein
LFARKNAIFFPVIISLLLLVFCIFTVGHMRYLVTYYPFILFGWLNIFAVKKSLR